MRKLMYPQIADLLVGQSFFIPEDEVNLPSLRVAVGTYAKRNGVRLSVHKIGNRVEIARRASGRGEAIDAYIAQSIERVGLNPELTDEIRAVVDAVLEEFAAR